MQADDVEYFIANCDKKVLYLIRRLSQKRIDELNKAETNKLATVATPWAQDMAKVLAELGRNNFPFVHEPNLADWAIDIDKLHRIDKQPTELVEGLLKWSQTDPFWKKQVRSGRALRKHFEKVYIAGKSAYDEQKNRKGKVYSV